MAFPVPDVWVGTAVATAPEPYGLDFDHGLPPNEIKEGSSFYSRFETCFAPNNPSRVLGSRTRHSSKPHFCAVKKKKGFIIFESYWPVHRGGLTRVCRTAMIRRRCRRRRRTGRLHPHRTSVGLLPVSQPMRCTGRCSCQDCMRLQLVGWCKPCSPSISVYRRQRWQLSPPPRCRC